MSIAATVVLAAIGGLVVLLAMPVVISAEIDTYARPPLAAEVRLLFGLVRVSLPQAGAGRRSAALTTLSSSRAVALRRCAGMALRFNRAPALGRALSRLLRRVARGVHVREVVLRARIGLEDPADLGAAWGTLQPVLVYARARDWPVTLTPVFGEATLQVDGRLLVALRPLVLVLAVLRFVCTPAVLRIGVAAGRAA